MTRSWSRILWPSHSDLFFLFHRLDVSGESGWLAGLLQDSDTVLHTRTGQHILETASVPTHDLFSFTKPGDVWFAYEWLAEAAYGWLFNLAGFKGIVLLAGMLIALYITVLLKHTMWKGANGMIALVVMLLTATATSIHFLARPHLFTLLFLAIAVWVLDYKGATEDVCSGCWSRSLHFGPIYTAAL